MQPVQLSEKLIWRENLNADFSLSLEVNNSVLIMWMKRNKFASLVVFRDKYRVVS